MTDATKIKRVCGWIGSAAQAHAELCGGYPDIAVVVESSVVVAGEDADNGPQLTVYPRQYVLNWYEGIRQSIKNYPDEDISFHVWESMPPNPPTTYSA